MAGAFDRSAIMTSFVQELQTYIPEIANNLDRIQRQGQQPDILEEIYRRVHTIAGSAAMMDITGMAQVATAMETVVGDALDGAAPLNEQTIPLLQRSLGRLRQLMDLLRTNGDDSAIVAQDALEYQSLRRATPSGGSPLPYALGGPGMAQSQPVPQNTNNNIGWGDPRTPVPGFNLPNFGQQPPAPRPGIEFPPTMPLSSPLPMPGRPSQPVVMQTLQNTSVWSDVRADEQSVVTCANSLLTSINALRSLNQHFDGERTELLTFMDGSKDALDRLEQWASHALGFDLRTSPDQVRRYLPLSVLYVVTERMKKTVEMVNDAVRGLVSHQESMGDVLSQLHGDLERAGQLASAVVGTETTSPQGGYTATVAQFSYVPVGRATGELPAGTRAELERTVREELRRELEDEVRSEMAVVVRREEERRLRQELEIQLRRQLLAEFSPSVESDIPLSSGMIMNSMSTRQSVSAMPRRIIPNEQNAEALEIYRGEAEEHLRIFAEGLSILEKQPHNGEAIRSIRRAVHTLKGAAGITGFSTVADLCHICEDLLDKMGNGSVSLTEDIYSLLLDTSQALEAMIQGDTAEQGGEAGLLAALRPRYQVLLGETLELQSVASQAPVAPPRPATKVTEMTEHADDDLDVVISAGAEARAIALKNEASDLNIRLSLKKLDELINLFGDILVNRSVVEERMVRLTRMVTDANSLSDRLHEVGTQMERQYETTMLPSQRQQPFAGGQPPFTNNRFGAFPPFNPSGPGFQSAEFDPLELDHYNTFHELLRRLNESTTDGGTLNHEIEAIVREMEVALAKEGRLSSQFQDALLKARLVPISSLVPRLFRAVQAVAVKYNKEFELFVESENTDMDRTVYEDIAAPLLHLVRNAIYHGIETPKERAAHGKPAQGRITINAKYEGNQLIISVADDGNGISSESIRATAQARGLIDSYTQLSEHELVNLIFQPGFSTADTITEEGGRGIGLDVVRDMASRLRGTVEVDSEVGVGTTFTLKIPISLQIQRVVLVRVADQLLAISMNVVDQLVQLDFYPRSPNSPIPAIDVRGEAYPLLHLGSYIQQQPAPVNDKTPVLLIRSGNYRWGLMVDAIAGRQEIVAKNLGPHLRNVSSVSGATVLGNGQVILIIDPIEMLQRSIPAGAAIPVIPALGTPSIAGTAPREALGNALGYPQRAGAGAMSQAAVQGRPYILVVDDSPSVRRVVSTTLKNAGWDVQAARDGIEALELVAKQTPACVLLDIEMPRMDGYELIASLRNQLAYQQLPLIVLTSRAANKHQQRAFQLGANDYVVKPYQDDELLQKVAALVPVKPTGEAR